jgi:hypothetical protein
MARRPITRPNDSRKDRSMNLTRLLAVGVTVAAVGALSGCSGSDSAPEAAPPVTLTDVKAADGTAIKQVVLVDQAVQRIGITTAAVTNAVAAVNGISGPHLVLPYSAVVYDRDGSAWTYVNTAPRTYQRARITIAAIQGETAVLTAGPPQGTAVVTQGAPELLGAEAEIAGEE